MKNIKTEEQRFIMEREQILSLLPDPNNYRDQNYKVVYQTNIEKHNIPRFAYFVDRANNIKEHPVGFMSAKEVTYVYFTFEKKRSDKILNGVCEIKYTWKLIDCHVGTDHIYFGYADI